ncbi:hypothetical protein L7F22_018021 [Adiantum nelumboides]|nr:hypothetical protein [Adiantum nelumboides]
MVYVSEHQLDSPGPLNATSTEAADKQVMVDNRNSCRRAAYAADKKACRWMSGGMGSQGFAPFLIGVALIILVITNLHWEFIFQPHLDFVQKNGTNFVVGHKFFYVHGWNSYWLMAQGVDFTTRSAVKTVLQHGAAMGLSVCRTWAFYDGHEGLQTKAGQYSEDVFRMGRVKRPEWQYVDQVKACKKGQWTCKCKFCGHTWDGGPARIRYHLLKITGHGVGPCDQVPDAVKEVVTRLHADARGDGTDRNDYVNELVNAMGEEASQSVNDATASTHASDSSKSKKRKGYEANLGSAFHLQARKHADQALRRFFYAEDIPEWKVRSPFFLEMVKAIGQAGPSYVPPSHHALRTTHLNDEVKCIKSDLMAALDYAIVEARRQGVRLLLSLVNNLPAFGGKGQYVEWARSAGSDLGSSNDSFFSDATVRHYYKHHLKTVLTRVNSLSGVAYRDEPAIFAWELINEPRCQSDLSGDTLQSWIEEMAKYAKFLDEKHLLTVGFEGFYGQSSPEKFEENPGNWAKNLGSDFIRHSKIDLIDFTSVHVYPDTWLPNLSIMEKKNFTEKWVASHIEDATNVLHKPVLFTEFGVSDQTRDFDTKHRVELTDMVYDKIYKSAKEGGAGAGALVWQFLVEGVERFHDEFTIIPWRDPNFYKAMVEQSCKLYNLSEIYNPTHLTCRDF